MRGGRGGEHARERAGARRGEAPISTSAGKYAIVTSSKKSLSCIARVNCADRGRGKSAPASVSGSGAFSTASVYPPRRRSVAPASPPRNYRVPPGWRGRTSSKSTSPLSSRSAACIIASTFSSDTLMWSVRTIDKTSSLLSAPLPSRSNVSNSASVQAQEGESIASPPSRSPHSHAARSLPTTRRHDGAQLRRYGGHKLEHARSLWVCSDAMKLWTAPSTSSIATALKLSVLSSWVLCLNS